MATTIELPLELSAMDPTKGNSFWAVKNGPLWYQGVYRFHRHGDPALPSGEGLMAFETNIPPNLASPANWNLVLHHENASGDAGAVLLRVAARVLASGDSPTVPTVIVPNQLFGVGASGDQNITDLSASSFDALVALTAGKRLFVEMRRLPLTSSGDTLVGGWDLNYPPLLRVDVT